MARPSKLARHSTKPPKQNARSLARYVDEGGALIDVRTKQTYFSLRELPIDLFTEPEKFKPYTGQEDIEYEEQDNGSEDDDDFFEDDENR